MEYWKAGMMGLIRKKHSNFVSPFFTLLKNPIFHYSTIPSFPLGGQTNRTVMAKL